MLSNNQGFTTESLTLNQEGSIKQLLSCPLWLNTWGVSVPKVRNISESSDNYLGAVQFDVTSCTLYLKFNWVVQQFEEWRCLHQWTDECNSDSVLSVCWSVRNRDFYSMAQQPLVDQGLLFIKASRSHTDMRNRSKDLNVIHILCIQNVVHIILTKCKCT
jgi:hypothetical protein